MANVWNGLTAAQEWRYSFLCASLTLFATMLGAFGRACTPGSFSVGNALYWPWLVLRFDAPYVALGIAVLTIALFLVVHRIGTVNPNGRHVVVRLVLVLPLAGFVLAAVLTPGSNNCVYL